MCLCLTYGWGFESCFLREKLYCGHVQGNRISTMLHPAKGNYLQDFMAASGIKEMQRLPITTLLCPVWS